jgi:acyl-CoA thioester hydrolase
MPWIGSRYRILYGDTDAMGLVYYANYLRWFEMGRNEWLRALGTTYKDIERSGTFAPVTKAYCHYLNPARYDDWIVVETDVEYVRKASLKFIYRVIREEGVEKLVEGYTVHAFVNAKGQVVRAPEMLSDAIKRLKVHTDQLERSHLRSW